ncbi:CBS domain-containing protein (plasmid) [Nitratireductor rhodophyticola]|jgi:CBS domain-containing protein|nr:CBS domain-containing protein [Nitratireductor rhodophyticola]WPZ16394.1 CBS domain-containing protein [Nitratireductor rhodophyticola]
MGFDDDDKVCHSGGAFSTSNRKSAMQVQDVMTSNPACCGPDTSMKEAAKLMAEHDCGELPVVDDEGRPIGVVTDRDMACRGVAEDKNPSTPVREVMSSPAVTATPDMDLDDCCSTLEENQIRRVPVVDEKGACCGMVSQADIALHGSEHETAQLVRDVSKPSSEPSRAGCC